MDFIKMYYTDRHRCQRKSFYDMETLISIPFDEPKKKYPSRLKPKYYPRKQSYMYYKFYRNRIISID